MPVNRNLWSSRIEKDKWPAGWHCPTCSGGYLQLVADGLRFDEAALSRHAHDEVWFEPEHIENRFVAMLRCASQDCLEVVVVLGRGSLEGHAKEDMSEEFWEEYFVPAFVYPPVQFIPLPDAVPGEVREELAHSFSLLWTSPSAAANHVRIAVERLLDKLRIPRVTRQKGSSKAGRLTLHDRIVNLTTRKREVGDALLAIKWIGNAGSHLGELGRNDLFDAYDILEGILSRLFVKNDEATSRLVREINRRKGPRARHKKVRSVLI